MMVFLVRFCLEQKGYLFFVPETGVRTELVELYSLPIFEVQGFVKYTWAIRFKI